MRSLLVSSLFALPLLAQSDLLDRAAALPPELYADVVLRLAEADTSNSTASPSRSASPSR